MKVTRFFTLLLLLLLIVNINGYFLVFKMSQLAIRKEAKGILARAAENDLLDLCINEEDTAQIKWKEKSEFEFQNRRYDVQRIDVINRKIHYFCLEDKKENKLLEVWNSKSASKGNTKTYILKNLLKVCFTVYLRQSAFWFEKVVSIKKSYSASYLKELLTFYDEVIIPPPIKG